MNEEEKGGHLSRVELARLVDEGLGAAERVHLEACERCRSELAALTAQVRSLAGLPDLRPPEGDVSVLERRLAEEGLIVGAAPAGPAPAKRATGALSLPGADPRRVGSRVGFGFRSGWLQAAAGVLLFVAGAVSGATLVPNPASDGSLVAEAQSSRPPDGPAGILPPVTPATWTLEESEERVRAAENLFVEAMLGYRDQLTLVDPGRVQADPLERLVLLENLLSASEVAVREVPADPFFNGLLLSTTAEHRATIEDLTFASQPF